MKLVMICYFQFLLSHNTVYNLALIFMIINYMQYYDFMKN